jgi:hypothetical protein
MVFKIFVFLPVFCLSQTETPKDVLNNVCWSVIEPLSADQCFKDSTRNFIRYVRGLRNNLREIRGFLLRIFKKRLVLFACKLRICFLLDANIWSVKPAWRLISMLVFCSYHLWIFRFLINIFVRLLYLVDSLDDVRVEEFIGK